MVIFEPPEFANVTDCDWLLPTETLPKLMVDGVTTSCPVPAIAFELNARMIGKRKSKQYPRWTALYLGAESFTIRPLKPH
jgi:hypothetical protein